MTRQQASTKGIDRDAGATEHSFYRPSAPDGAADAQCAPLQSVQRGGGSRCRIPRLTARRVVEDADPYRVRRKIRACTGGTPGEYAEAPPVADAARRFQGKHDFRRSCAGNRNAATRIADPYKRSRVKAQKI